MSDRYPNVEVLTAQQCRERIARALAGIHERLDETELARRVESYEACHHEVAAWDTVRSYRWLLGACEDE